MKKDSFLITAAALAVAMLIVISNVNAEGRRHIIAVVPVDSEDTGEPRMTKSPANLMIYHTGRASIKDVHLLIVIDKSTYDGLSRITIDSLSISIYKDDFIEVTGDLKFGNCKYEANAIRDKLAAAAGDPIYYCFVYFADKITTKTYFTLEIDSTQIKALVLALGKDHSDVFNACSSFSKSTFVIPEIATLALATASIAALGAYAYKRKR